MPVRAGDAQVLTLDEMVDQVLERRGRVTVDRDRLTPADRALGSLLVLERVSVDLLGAGSVSS